MYENEVATAERKESLKWRYRVRHESMGEKERDGQREGGRDKKERE